ncbi:MAG: hypothetical protein LBC88_06830 [Spirochaetaceae bacterium]|jgi:hypothetical protein|nr:hypothetical protein [Spirochaetaceae bacterium]
MSSKSLVFVFLFITINVINAEEHFENNRDIENNESIENVQPDRNNVDNSSKNIGVVFSFSGFNRVV